MDPHSPLVEAEGESICVLDSSFLETHHSARTTTGLGIQILPLLLGPEPWVRCLHAPTLELDADMFTLEGRTSFPAHRRHARAALSARFRRICSSGEVKTDVFQVTWVEALPPPEPGVPWMRICIWSVTERCRANGADSSCKRGPGRSRCVSSSQHRLGWTADTYHHQEAVYSRSCQGPVKACVTSDECCKC